MSGRLAFSSMASAKFGMLENGLGLVLRNSRGQFFCGFRQPDGRLAFSQFRQSENGALARGESLDFNRDHAVFLSPEDMKAQQFGAAVFAEQYEAACLSHLSQARLNDCRYALVRKDLTAKTSDAAEDSSSLLVYSIAGLASAAACEQGEDKGFVSIRRDLAEKWQSVRGMVGRTLSLP